MKIEEINQSIARLDRELVAIKRKAKSDISQLRKLQKSLKQQRIALLNTVVDSHLIYKM